MRASSSGASSSVRVTLTAALGEDRFAAHQVPHVVDHLDKVPGCGPASGSSLSKRVSTISLMWPGRADMTAMRSARNTASCTSWVTKMTVLRERCQMSQELALHQAAGLRVERAERLVHQQDMRIDRQRAGDRGALLHAAESCEG